MTFLGDWGCASNKQNAPVYVRGHCLLTCEATTIADLVDRYLIKEEQDIWQEKLFGKSRDIPSK